MSTSRKIVYTLLLTAVLFVAAFAAGFFTVGLALAQPTAEHTSADEQMSGEHAPAGEHGAEHGGHHDPSKEFKFFGPPFGHGTKDVAGGKLGDGVNHNPETGVTIPGEEEPMSAPFIYMVLNFALLLFILMKYGGPAAKKGAADRHDQIKAALDEAAKLRKQAADKLAEYETRLADADSEIKKLVEGMRADAEADKTRILENAERQSAQMKRDAEMRIAAEIELARATLTREVTAAATKATAELLRAKMVPGDQAKLVATFITDIQTTVEKGAR